MPLYQSRGCWNYQLFSSTMLPIASCVIFSTFIVSVQAYFYLTPALSDEDMDWIESQARERAMKNMEGAQSLRSYHDTFLRARHSDRDTITVDLACHRKECERWNVEQLDGKVNSFWVTKYFLNNTRIKWCDVMMWVLKKSIWDLAEIALHSWWILDSWRQWESRSL